MVTRSASTSARSADSVDRFYSPPAVRRKLEEQRRQIQLLEEHKRQDAAAAEAPSSAPHKPLRPKPHPSPSPAPVSASTDPDCRLDSATKPPTAGGNLHRFLESTTISVPAQHFPKMGARGWRNCNGGDPNPYFNLGDLWKTFGEWSAYGAGVPLVLNGGDTVVQYYVPYLSGIQLYVDSSRPTIRSSDYSGDNEADSLTRERRSSSSLTSCMVQEGFPGDDGEASTIHILPVFQYFERDPPYGREPLADKIALLADRFPGLETYNSCDLLPSSWVSVAWYPIYRIPTGPTLKDLDACFLTFHTLATHSKVGSNGYPDAVASSGKRYRSKGLNGRMNLQTFGLALYKFKSSIWASNVLYETQLATSLLQAAENWLRSLGVEHPDFQFFMSRNNGFWR